MCIGLNLEILGQCCDCSSVALGANCRSHRCRSTIAELYLDVPEQLTGLINTVSGSDDKIIPDKSPSRKVYLTHLAYWNRTQRVFMWLKEL